MASCWQPSNSENGKYNGNIGGNNKIIAKRGKRELAFMNCSYAQVDTKWRTGKPEGVVLWGGVREWVL